MTRGDEMWKAIRNACKAHKEIEIAVPVTDGLAKISTVRGGPPWSVPMLVHIHVTRRSVEWRQYYLSAEEAKENLDREEKRYTEWKADMEEAKRRMGS